MDDGRKKGDARDESANRELCLYDIDYYSLQYVYVYETHLAPIRILDPGSWILGPWSSSHVSTLYLYLVSSI